MLALSEPDLEPFTYISVGPRIGGATWALNHRSTGYVKRPRQAADDEENFNNEDATVVLSGGVDRDGSNSIQKSMPYSDLGGRTGDGAPPIDRRIG